MVPSQCVLATISKLQNDNPPIFWSAAACLQTNSLDQIVLSRPKGCTCISPQSIMVTSVCNQLWIDQRKGCTALSHPLSLLHLCFCRKRAWLKSLSIVEFCLQ